MSSGLPLCMATTSQSMRLDEPCGPRPEETAQRSSRRTRGRPCFETRLAALLSMRPIAELLRGLLVRVLLHVQVNELQRVGGLLQHPPALEPVVGALHLIERDRRGIAHDQPALAQVLDLERRDLRV